MTTYKLKVHISGQHDFEAEGDKETVERQFAAFTELVRNVIGKTGLSGGLPESLAKIVRTDDTIFLAAVPATSYPAADALLILRLAHKAVRGQGIVSGKELVDSLRKSGMASQRIDKALGHYLGGTQALVVKMGIRRGVKYKLTERGLSKATELAGTM